MNREISLFKNNNKREWEDIEWIEEFYEFLQGEIPEAIHLRRGYKPKLSQKKAFSIIYYLQEHFPIIPDHIEQCSNCGSLFDDWSEGVYWETKGKHFCGGCVEHVPENYDRSKK